MTRWRATRPWATHWQEASCAEVACVKYLTGWQTILPAGDAGNADYIRRSGMRFQEERDADLVRFTFEPGQECFTGQGGRHRRALERDPVLWRGRQVLEPMEWMDTMNDHLNRYRGG